MQIMFQSQMFELPTLLSQLHIKQISETLPSPPPKNSNLCDVDVDYFELIESVGLLFVVHERRDEQIMDKRNVMKC